MRTVVAIVAGVVSGTILGLLIEETVARPFADEGAVDTGSAMGLGLIWPLSIAVCVGTALVINARLRRRNNAPTDTDGRSW
jgi:hypothetical protein